MLMKKEIKRPEVIFLIIVSVLVYTGFILDQYFISFVGFVLALLCVVIELIINKNRKKFIKLFMVAVFLALYLYYFYNDLI